MTSKGVPGLDLHKGTGLQGIKCAQQAYRIPQSPGFKYELVAPTWHQYVIKQTRECAEISNALAESPDVSGLLALKCMT